jgi:hypothetical protein
MASLFGTMTATVSPLTPVTIAGSAVCYQVRPYRNGGVITIVQVITPGTSATLICSILFLSAFAVFSLQFRPATNVKVRASFTITLLCLRLHLFSSLV